MRRGKKSRWRGPAAYYGANVMVINDHRRWNYKRQETKSRTLSLMPGFDSLLLRAYGLIESLQKPRKLTILVSRVA